MGGGPEKGRVVEPQQASKPGGCLLLCLFAGGVLGDSLGAFTDGVFGQLTGQEETDSGLDLPGGDGAALVVVGKTAGFS